MEKLSWWGYVHQNGSYHVKRYFSPDDIFEANTSPFVQKTYGPFEANNYEDALKVIDLYEEESSDNS